MYGAAANSNLVGKLNMNVMKEAAMANLQISENAGQARQSTASSHYEAIDVVKAMAAKARSQQALLEERIEELEAKLHASASTPQAKKKTARARKRAKK